MSATTAPAQARTEERDWNKELSNAAGKGYTRQCRSLIGQGADVNAIDSLGLTPLLRASIGSRMETMRLLLDSGADINAVDRNGWGALLRAANQRRADICRFLVERGADLNAAGRDGRTPLAWSAFNGRVIACQLLVENGASPSYVPPNAPADYLTPFQTAVAFDRATVVQYFADELGEDFRQRTLNGRTMFDLAEDKPNARALLLSMKTQASVEAGCITSGGSSASTRKAAEGFGPL